MSEMADDPMARLRELGVVDDDVKPDCVIAHRLSESHVKSGARVDLKCNKCGERLHLMPKSVALHEAGAELLCRQCAIARAEAAAKSGTV